MAPHSSILAWKIPRTGAWWATVHRVTESQKRLKQLSTHAKLVGETKHTSHLLQRQPANPTVVNRAAVPRTDTELAN